MTSSILYWENENSGEIRVEKSIDQGVPEETEVQTMHFIEKIDRQVSFCVIEEDGYLVIYDYETQETIAAINKEFGYTPDTHTAVAINVYDKYVKATGDAHKTVIASTANPFKFNESVINAVAGEGACDGLDEFALLDKLAELSGMEIPASLGELKTKNVRFTTVCNKEDMKSETNKFLA